jgi:glycosyltransferase involved in cell wall biosynthesis
MHIGYVLVPYQRFTGAGEYYHSLIREILELGGENKYTIFFPHGVDTSLFDKYANAVCVNTAIRSSPGPLRYVQTMLSDFAEKFVPKIDLLHCFNFPVPRFSNGKLVLTVYDLREEDLPQTDGRVHRTIMHWLKPGALRRAHHVITISNFSKQRLDYHYPFCKSKSSSIYLSAGLADAGRALDAAPSPRSRPYVFAIGQIAPHKNLANLIRAFNILLGRGCDYDLVIAGHNFGSSQFAKNLYDLPVDKTRVIFTGRLTDVDKITYLRNAKLFVYPSLYEGFGIPLLEAFEVKTPLAVSRIPVFEEIFGLPEAMFDPLDPADMARVIERICSQDSLREAIVSHATQRLSRFSWQETARQTMAVYAKLGHS